MTRPVVFLGPSLPLERARDLLDADYRAPVRQGDLMRVLAQDRRPPAIAIIDGVFQGAPTVRHREILWALHQGVPVYGAASMGALRAAELADAGMIGSGLIYRWYRRFPLTPDDAVAVEHAPAELGSTSLSCSLVDLRRTIAAARRAQAIDTETAAMLVEEARGAPYAKRSISAICGALAARCDADGLENALNSVRVFQKAADAEGVLSSLAECQRKGDWPTVTAPRPPIVHAWLDDLRDGGCDIPANLVSSEPD